jgi:hypothetical protein
MSLFKASNHHEKKKLQNIRGFYSIQEVINAGYSQKDAEKIVNSGRNWVNSNKNLRLDKVPC